VSDLKKSVSFYQGILGLEKMGEWPNYAIFDIAGVSFGLEPKDWRFVYSLRTLTRPIEILRIREPSLLPSQKISLGVFETRLLLTLTGTSLSSSPLNVRSAEKFVRVIPSF